MRKIHKIKGIVVFNKTYYVALNTHPRLGDVVEARSLIDRLDISSKNPIIKVDQMAHFDHKIFYKVIKGGFKDDNPFYFFVEERINI